MGRRAAAVVTACLAVLAWVWLRPSDDQSPVGELTRRIERTREPDAFAFSYASGGTRVNDCLLPNRRFSGIVDYRSGAMLISLDPDGHPVAGVLGRTGFVHRSLLRAGAVAFDWVRVPPGSAGASVEAVRRAVGTGLAGYVFAEGLPASGRATVLELLRVATDVVPVGSEDVSGRDTERLRIEVDAEAFLAATETSAVRDGGTDELVPEVEVWLADDDVVRVSIRVRGDGGAVSAPEEGWVVDYAAARGPVAGGEYGPAQDVAALDAADLSRPIGGCAVPIG